MHGRRDRHDRRALRSETFNGLLVAFAIAA
jgi:hypothetical protein